MKMSSCLTPLASLCLQRIVELGLILMMGMSVSAEAGYVGGTSWREEVLLHDGSKIIVERSVELGGRHELGQKPPIREQSLSFTLLNTDQRVKWEDHYADDLGGANFNPMLLDVVDGVPYVLAAPAGCLSYNKWGRPNPPYVVFRYQGKKWKRIPLQELPAGIKLPNLVISAPDDVAKEAKHGVLSAELVKQANEGFGQREYRTILREPVKNGGGITGCEELVHYKCGWGAPGEFNRKYFESTCK